MKKLLFTIYTIITGLLLFSCSGTKIKDISKTERNQIDSTVRATSDTDSLLSLLET